MSLDPIETTRAITKRYNSYLATSFNLKDSDLKKQFLDELSHEKFVKGPILEITPPFESGKTIAELIDEGILSSEFKKLNVKALPLDRPLYKHQESGILKNILENENIIVATGTGSGKTETFIIPILNYLFRQKEKSELTPGVRALLLYPMNALANDQLKRMRKILENYPDITFGRYTGETEESQKSAKEKFVKMYKTEPLPNERISREEMKKKPPHILLTNYAMLEYLMLRPADNVFFDGNYADNWKFIVIDEAHTYNGAKGIEMGMLLRRLKERVVQSSPSNLRCIATSATLGNGANKLEDITYFASELFGEPFSSKSFIGASRRKDIQEASWGAPSSELYCKWQKIINDNPLDMITLLVKSGKTCGIPTEILENAKLRSFNDLNKFLYYTLKDDGNLVSLKAALEIEPQSVETIAEKMFLGDSNPKRALVSLVELAVKAKCGEDDQSLIPARYHLFVRDIEGAYLSLKPEFKIYLERREHVVYEEQEYSVFEIASCRNCGAVYLVGETEKEEKKFKQPGNKYYEDSNNLEYYLILDKNTQLLPENEDEITDIVQDEKQRHTLCGKCGAIDRSSKVGPICKCGDENYIEILRVESSKGSVHKCPACTKTNTKGSVVFRFLLGKDAIASVLATCLYQQIPAKKANPEDNSKREKSEQDEWTFTATQNVDIKSNYIDLRQLLIFSDSRQDAAFFAPYLNRTYSQILRRRLLLEVVENNIDKIQENNWRIQDLIPVLKQQVVKLNIFPDYSQQEVENEIWKWILHELLVIDSKIGLEGMGCLGFKLAKPEGWRAPPPLLKEPLNLSEDEVWTLYKILLDGFRKYGAVLYPEPINPDDEFFEPINQDRYFRESGTSKNKNIKSWVPSSEKSLNTRLDFLMRLAQNMGISYSRKECMDLLRNIWKSLSIENSGSLWYKYFLSTNLKGEGVAYKIKPNFWELQPVSNSKGEKWYYCERCNNLTLFNLKGTCPTYKCEGRLRECDPDEILKDNHYRNLYYELLPLRMWSEEHTAQLKSEAAAELQTHFIKGEVNVLSCSTTFELGVDVGELESVFMRNVPPSASNYIQRAGRAGRRTDSTAFVLTFCKRSPHDLTHFYSPIKLVSGEIKPPHFEILNEKIILRHIYATALSEFWKKYPSMFNNVESFFFNEGKSGPELFKDYLDSKPEDLYESLRRIIPKTLHKKLKLDDWGWAQDLYNPKEGVMLKAKDDVETDVNNLNKILTTLQENNKPSDFVLRFLNTIKKRSLLNSLSSHSVIPKYGFPVDVVELQILGNSEDASKLELNRDLRIALSEYAPGSQVVAGGKLWTSRYLKRLPQREWPKYRYAVCEYCQRYQRVIADSDEKLDVCDSCGMPLKGKSRGTFIIPEFGFIASRKKPKKVGESRPERTYSTRSYYSGESDKDNERILNLKSNIVLRAISASHGKMGVINHAGHQRFKVCNWCGYTVLGNEKAEETHETIWGSPCSGKLYKYDLGHEYMTDILQLHFEGYSNSDIGFWYSLLYAILEGASESLDIDRQDLDGCLYPMGGDLSTQSILLFDDVPGGAGHVKRIIQEENTIIEILKCTLSKLKNCSCGGEIGDTSCYGCLRNYQNQFCHDLLKRGTVIKFLEENMP